mgnify:CR=1 FL=1
MWMMEKLLTCECGTRLEEWDKDKGGERRAYVVETFVCPGCAGITEAVDAAHQNAKVGGKSGVPGLKVKLTPKWLVDYRIKNRSAEERERMREREAERLMLERAGGADSVNGAGPTPKHAGGLGGSRRPPINPK